MAVALSAIVGGIWFCVQFLLTLFQLCSVNPAEAILSALSSSIDTKSALVGFVAMEYFGLILNRTFVIFVTPEALYGWKGRGPVTNMRSMYFPPYAQLLDNLALMHNREAIQKLASLKGGFVIPRSQVLGVELVGRKKWGMGAFRILDEFKSKHGFGWHARVCLDFENAKPLAPYRRQRDPTDILSILEAKAGLIVANVYFG